jgi:hypothetical protein
MISPTAITTLAHLYAITVSPNPVYSGMILCSTAASFAWHTQPESRLVSQHIPFLAIVDYGFAAIWVGSDITYASITGTYIPVFIALGTTGALGLLTEFHHDPKLYEFWHSLWHFVSALRAYFVAYLFSAMLAVKPSALPS